MFYSGNFIYNGKRSDDYYIHLVSENGDVLNEYGINFSDEEEITLTFCYASEYGEAYVWSDEILEFVHEWFITDNFNPFISEDSEDLMYLLRGKSITKRFTPDFKGLIDVTFDVYSNYAYKKQVVNVNNSTKPFYVTNLSNVNKEYRPIIELNNIQTDTITISNLTYPSEDFILTDIAIGSNVIIDNEIGTITDSNGNNLIMNSNRKWIGLKRGRNRLQITGDCSAKVKSLYPIMR